MLFRFGNRYLASPTVDNEQRERVPLSFDRPPRDQPCRVDFDTKFLSQFTHNGAFCGLTWLDSASRDIPNVGVGAAGRVAVTQ